MKKTLQDTIFKFTGIFVEDEHENLLNLPVLMEYWLYIIAELEDVHSISVVPILDKIGPKEFTLEKINEELNLSVIVARDGCI